MDRNKQWIFQLKMGTYVFVRNQVTDIALLKSIHWLKLASLFFLSINTHQV